MKAESRIRDTGNCNLATGNSRPQGAAVLPQSPFSGTIMVGLGGSRRGYLLLPFSTIFSAR
jgi:hypothetical protein